MNVDTPIWNSMVSPKDGVTFPPSTQAQASIDAAIANFHKMNRVLDRVVEHDIPKARDNITRHKKAVERRKKRKRGGHK